jgi:molybdenum cofactor synthesis domain-containing protein
MMSFRGIDRRIDVEKARELIFLGANRISAEEVAVVESLDRVVFSEVRSATDIPHFDRSAMDGYAVIASDTFGSTQQTPRKLDIIGESRVGEIPRVNVGSGKAVEVATGSQVPEGADAIVKFENTDRAGNILKVHFPVTPGENISKMGEDIKKGEVIVDKGQLIRPQDIAALLVCGVLRIQVAKKPTVGVIATGNELVEPQTTQVPAKVFNINSHSLSSYVTLYGGKPNDLGIVGDSFNELKKALESALQYDLVVFTGSTSVGKRDMLPEIVSSVGKIVFRGVSMRPGSPTTVGLVNGKHVFLLPGYPVANMIAFETFVGPTIRKMMGANCLDPRCQATAVLGSRVPSALGRRDYVRVSLQVDSQGELVAHPLRSSGSGIISSMTKADGIVEIPEEAEGLEKGSKVIVKLFPK